MANLNKSKLKRGWVAVQVGLADDGDDQHYNECTRRVEKFCVPISYLYNPLFQELLDRASEVYGYNINGPLMLPCSVEDFLHLRWQIENYRNYPGKEVENLRLIAWSAYNRLFRGSFLPLQGRLLSFSFEIIVNLMYILEPSGIEYLLATFGLELLVIY